MSEDRPRGAPRIDEGPAGGAGSGVPGGAGAGGGQEGIGSLISGTLKDLQELVRAEVQLAKTELKEDAAAAGRAIAVLAAGAVVGLVGFIVLMFALAYLLNQWIRELWLATGIVGLALAVIAAVLVASGRSKLRAASLKPEQTIDTLKEDQAWAKQQINSVKR